MFEKVNLDTLMLCVLAFVLVFGFQLATMKLAPTVRTANTKYGRERDGDFECSGKRQSEFNKRIQAAANRKGK
jgi:hypothetical protein